MAAVKSFLIAATRLLSFFMMLCICGSEEASDAASRCSSYTTTPLSSYEYKSMKLWPLHEHEESPHRHHHQTIYGFAHAIKKVYEHQHPENCKDKKFFIYPGHLGGGFGSNLHVEGVMIAVAMNMGRIYLPHPRYSHTLKWPFEYPFCSDHHELNFNCYYETLSSCTYNDAFPDYNYSDPMSWPEDFGDLVTPPFGEGILKPSFAASHKVVRVPHGAGVQAYYSNVYPNMFAELLTCGGFRGEDRGRWWNSISVAFQVRPNARSLQKLSQFHSQYPELNLRHEQPVIGMYVRHGDKKAEMTLVPLQQYLDTAQSIWDQGLAHVRHGKSSSSSNNGGGGGGGGGGSGGISNSVNGRRLIPLDSSGGFRPAKNGTIFLGTEDPQVITDAVAWGRANGWKVIFTQILDRKRMDAACLPSGQGGPYDGEYRHGHHELEYLSMLLNLELLLYCAVWVSTMASGYNQVVDELRNTVMGKADLVNADLVYGKPPFLYRGFYHASDQKKLKNGP